MSKCPSCGKAIYKPKVKRNDATPADSYTRPMFVVEFSCPSCDVCLGVSPDPRAMTETVIDEVYTALGKRRPSARRSGF